MAEIRIDHVTKTFGAGVTAVDDVSLTVADGEFVVLLGPSGCGKSTLLRMVAGLEEVSAGTISIGGNDATFVTPRLRDVAMVFQNYALYPHLTVYDNLAFPLKMRKLSRAAIRQRVEETARRLQLSEFLQRKPAQLSGGQQQRVALGRAMVRQPAVFLFDEPLSNLDAMLRVSARQQIRELHRERGGTMLYVTHDQIEAMTLGDRIVVMNAGVVQQIGPPQAVYQHPANTFVAGFLGSPGMNLLPKTVRDGRFVSDGQPGLDRLALPTCEAGTLILGLRPETLIARDIDSESSGSERPYLIGTVQSIEPLGAETMLYVDVANQIVAAQLDATAAFALGQRVALDFDATAVRPFDSTGHRVRMPNES